MKKLFPLLMLLALNAEAAQYRAFWIETFRTPLATHEDIERVIDAAVTSNANALFVQVRRRGDSWYLDTAEPLTETPGVGEPDPRGAWTFDPFSYLITQAHQRGIEVHAFVIVGSVHRENAPPKDPQHVFLQHVWDPTTNAPYRDARQWATRTLPHNTSGTTFDGQRYGLEWYIDLGNPEAAAYTVDVLLHLIRRYDIDGLHLDRIRYPEAPVDRNGGANVGYNAASVARFKARYGSAPAYYEDDDVGKKIGGYKIVAGDVGNPRTNDPLWSQWRREQVTNLLRRLYLNAIALKPSIKISCALIAFGSGPNSNGGFQDTEAYYRVFQDWASWAHEGIVDIVTPMTYKREHIAAERRQFDEWLAFTARVAHEGGRLAMPGIGAYLNAIEGTLRQARRASATADGVIFFAVGDTTPNSTAANSTNAAMPHNPFVHGLSTPKRPNADFFAALSRGTSADGEKRFDAQPLFANPAAPPPMPWKSKPTTGHVMGFVRDANGKLIDGGRVYIESQSTREQRIVMTDGGGFFGALSLAPGDYRIDGCTFRIIAGSVTQIDVPCPNAQEAAGSE